MNTEDLQIFDMVSYSVFDTDDRPEERNILTMIRSMIQSEASEGDYSMALKNYRRKENETVPFASLGELNEEHAFHPLALMLAGTETAGYSVYTIGTDKPDVHAVRSNGSNSIGRVYAPDDSETPFMGNFIH